MVYKTINISIFSISFDNIMNDHFNSEIIQELIKLYNRLFIKKIDSLCIDPNCAKNIKEDILMNALDFCHRHRNKFNPSKGNPLTYFATIFKSYVISELSMFDRKRLLSIQREKRINDLLGIPNDTPITYNI